MKVIKIDIKDEDMEEFLNKLEEFVNTICDTEECVKIEDLTISQYKKHYLIDSE